MSQVDKIERGSWALVKAHNPDPEIEKLRKEHNKAQKNLPKNEKSTFVPPLNNSRRNRRLHRF